MWHWEGIDPDRSGSSGDLAKMFKNEEIVQPGVFAGHPPSQDATLLAREVIQNSWDAARELHRVLVNNGQEPPEFRIRFHFRDLDGAAKHSFIEKLGLDELGARASGLDRSRLGLGAHDCLEELDGDAPLQILEITERGTTGMYGPWAGGKSKLYLALVSMGVTAKDEGSGGSYGYGKAGLIRGSAIRTIVAYTCFQARDDEPGVTRRLLGMTYWGLHDLGDDGYTGFARFGAVGDDGRVTPFVDLQADEQAAALDIAPRDPSNIDELGSTFVLVQPTVDPFELCSAIERSWWPAIEDVEDFTAEIISSSGERIFPRPRRNPVLGSFIRSWEVATVPQDNAVPTEMARTFQSFRATDGRTFAIGRVGLVADPSDWSYPQGGTTDESGIARGTVEHRSLVALVRGPRMVVEYLNAGVTAPFVRGTFVAQPDIDDLLRQTEPKLHDSWQPRVSTDGIDPAAPEVANVVLGRIKAAVGDFRRALRPVVPSGQDIRLPILDELFKQFLEGSGRRVDGPPPPEPRMVRIHILEQRLEPVPDSRQLIRLRAKIGYSLSPNYTAGEYADVIIGIRFVFVEDHGAGQRCELLVVQPAGFVARTEHEGSFIGRLSAEEQVFDAESQPYAADWTGRLVVTGEIDSGQTPTSASGEELDHDQ